MYPTLSDFLRDVFGINVTLPIQSYGLMMALAFIFGGWVAYKEMKRKEAEGLLIPIYQKEIVGAPATFKEIFWSAVFGFFLFMKVFGLFKDYDVFVKNPEHYILSFEGSWAAAWVGAIAFGAYTWWDKYRKRLPKPKIEYKKVMPHELIGNIMIVAGIWGIIGSKVFDALSNYKEYKTFELFTNFSEAWPTFKYMFFSFSGLAFLGGLIFGTVAVIRYLKKYNINVWQMTDVAALVIPLSYAIGRIGCQVSGDGCWGITNTAPKPQWLSFLPDWAWAYDYPNNVLHVKLMEPVYPTPLYETTIMLIVFFILWALRKKIKIPGILFSLYLIFGGIERFFIEFISHNYKYDIFGIHLTQAQLISIFMVITGTFGIFYILKNKEKVLEWSKPQVREININPSEKNKTK